MAKDLVIEIGTEEIPASYIPPALKQLERGLAETLAKERLSCRGLWTGATPRRLVIRAEQLAERQEDVTVEVAGPPKARAFDEEGKPTKAAIGFARGQGVDVGDLQVKKLPRGEYVVATVKHKGRPVTEILGQAFPDLVMGLEFPRTMRWRPGPFRFARPIRWILALLGEDVIPMEIAGLGADRITRGHRFLSPGSITVGSAGHYMEALEGASVLLDPEVRKARILEQIESLARERGGRVHADKELMDEVLYLMEYPTSVCGAFDASFLELPPEVVVTAMKEHQKYFAVEGEDGRLLPYFIAVGNSGPEAAEEVRLGNERVLEARLGDARFYWQEDLKTRMDEKVETLSKVVWQEKLGTMLEKTGRIEALSRHLAAGFPPEVEEAAARAAHLCKADLVTEMIRDGKEFTKLQGIMGREYARVSGESEEVATAIAEHYLPRYADDGVAGTLPGAIVGIADKIDTIVGCFGVGLIPSGSQDPYGLRRQGLGVVRTVIERELRVDLSGLIGRARDLYGDRLGEDAVSLGERVLDFFRTRMDTYLGDRGFRHDEIDAVLSLYCDDPIDAQARVEALRGFRENEEFHGLIVGFKRVRNIIKGVGDLPNLQKGMLSEDSEKKLHASVLTAGKNIAPLLEEQNYTQALKLLVMLRARIDDFFDRVMVMVEDTGLRNNRLALLREVESLFMGVADFSKIVIEGESKGQ
ncbi:MAG: glycine--tRNA ligase subunit beta [Candidatus Eisenbacteria sp.]|nr:glycine--tRNA ligase subunit beta [Candidatus Eisenbacteria bacterium]